MTEWVALLYSVVLTPVRRVKSSDLLELAEVLSLGPAKTVLSTGNLIFQASGVEAELSRRIEGQIAEAWGKPISVLIRSAEDLRRLLAANPFPTQTALDPAKVAVRVMRDPLPADLNTRMSEICSQEEAFALQDRALWIMSQDQLSLSPLARVAGSSKPGIGTFRNASALAKIVAALTT